MATIRILARTILSPVITSAALSVSLSICVCIGAMKSALAGKSSSTNTFQTVSFRQRKRNARFHKEVEPILLEDPDFQKLHQQFRTKIDLGIELLEAAMQHKVPFKLLLFDSWYLAEELVSMVPPPGKKIGSAC